MHKGKVTISHELQVMAIETTKEQIYCSPSIHTTVVDSLPFSQKTNRALFSASVAPEENRYDEDSPSLSIETLSSKANQLGSDCMQTKIFHEHIQSINQVVLGKSINENILSTLS